MVVVGIFAIIYSLIKDQSIILVVFGLVIMSYHSISGRIIIIRAQNKNIIVAEYLFFWRVNEIRQALEKAVFDEY